MKAIPEVAANGVVEVSNGSNVWRRDVVKDGLHSSGQNGVNNVGGDKVARGGYRQNGFINGQANAAGEQFFDLVEEVPILSNKPETKSEVIETPRGEICPNSAARRRLFMYGEMMAMSWELREEQPPGSGAAVILSTGPSARNVARRVISLSKGWMSKRPMIELVDYETALGSTGNATAIAQQLEHTCIRLADAQQQSEGQIINGRPIPTWLIIDLLELAPGLSTASTPAGYDVEFDAWPVGTSGLNWLELLEVFAWRHTRSAVAPHILILAQPQQRDEINHCLQQLASLRGVPFYVASPLDSAGSVLKPEVWQTQVANAMAGLLWCAEPMADEIDGREGSARDTQCVYALGSVAHFVPTDLIKAWLGMHTVETMIGLGIRDAVATYLRPPHSTLESEYRDDIERSDTDKADKNRLAVQERGAGRQSVEMDGVALGDPDIHALPILSADLGMNSSMIQALVPQNPVVRLSAHWQAGDHHAQTPAKELLMRVRGELLGIEQQQYKGRRSWLMEQLTAWERELYMWSAAVLTRTGEGSHFVSYENSLRSIWQALVQAAQSIEHKLAEAGDAVNASSEVLKTKMDAVDTSCDRWSAAATALGGWRFVRPDYGWFWWRTRSFVLPRQLEELSETYAAHIDARVGEANLHVMRQLCLAQMQDVRVQLYRAEELTRWFGGLHTFFESYKDEIEASLGSLWTSSTLEGLWQAMQNDARCVLQNEQFDAFLREKPLPSWLKITPTEICAQVAAVVEPWPVGLDEANVLALLMMAHADDSCTVATTWLDAFVAQGEALWPREYLAADAVARHYLMTPSMRVMDSSVDELAGESTDDSVDKAEEMVSGTQADDETAWSYADSMVAAWCSQQPNVERVESDLDGLVVVYAVPTDLEGLWL